MKRLRFSQWFINRMIEDRILMHTVVILLVLVFCYKEITEKKHSELLNVLLGMCLGYYFKKEK